MSDLISRQAILDRTVNRNSVWNTITDSEGNNLEDILNSIPSVEKKEEWIPVTERLPKEENKSYWICTDYGYQCECRWTNVNHIWPHLTTDWHWHIMDIPQYSKVVAWMPLPEPYKSEKGE